LCGLIAATLWAFLLPSVKTSLYFNCEPKALDATPSNSSHLGTIESVDDRGMSLRNKCSLALAIMWSHLCTAYTNPNVLLWSFWYAMGVCGFWQVLSYIQMLWIRIDNREEVMWNGAVEACATLLGATVALLASRVHKSTRSTIQKLGYLLLFSLMQGGGLFIAASTTNRFVSYAGYLLFYILYTFTITISSAEIAKDLPDDSFGLIFGINTFAALFMQTILTVIVVTDTFDFNLNLQQQFFVYSYFYVVLGLLYLIPIAYGLICSTNTSVEVEVHQRIEGADVAT